MFSKEKINSLLSEDVILIVASPGMWDTPAHPQEQILVQKSVEKRQREFSAGRACARQALLQLGITDFPLLADNERVPMWPQGIIGSISHTRNDCIAVVAQQGQLQGIGVDIEEVINRSTEIQNLICIPEEKQWLSTIGSSTLRLKWLTVLFSAKESVYKALYPKHRVPLDFKDLYIKIDTNSNHYEVKLLNRENLTPILAGKYLCSEKHIFTSCEYITDAPAI